MFTECSNLDRIFVKTHGIYNNFEYLVSFLFRVFTNACKTAASVSIRL